MPNARQALSPTWACGLSAFCLPRECAKKSSVCTKNRKSPYPTAIQPFWCPKLRTLPLSTAWARRRDTNEPRRWRCSQTSRKKTDRQDCVAMRASLGTALKGRSVGGHTPKYAKKSGLSELPNVAFSGVSAQMEGTAGRGSRHVVGLHVFQDFAPRNGRAKKALPVLGAEAEKYGLQAADDLA